MSNFTVLFDANVLYPAPLRDFLLRLAVTDLFRAKWTDDIHEEWISNVLKNAEKKGNLNITREKLERTKALMNEYAQDALVTDYKELIETLKLPDPDDRHVLAAAIKGRCDLIVTFNLKDFPENILAKYGLQACHPDDFITDLIDLSNITVAKVAKIHRESLKNPPKDIDEYLSTLESQGLAGTVSELEDFKELI